MATTSEQFETIFPLLVEDITNYCNENHLPAQTLDWLQRSLHYNTVGGKYNRGRSVVDTTRILLGRALTPEEYFQSATLGWLIELFQAFMLVTDDIMDASKTRRGQACWYLAPRVGMLAINDACMLESCIYILLKKHFRHHPAYVDMMELMHDVTFRTEAGQACDLLAEQDGADISHFSLPKYQFIAVQKTAYYSFYLPIALALLYTGRGSAQNLLQARNITLPMGEYFQVQDDFLDAFADPKSLGKIGTDIQDNKCSWLINQALLNASPEQRLTLAENYGRKDESCESVVKVLYHQLHLQQSYLDYEESKVAELRRKISEVDESDGMRKEVFEEFLMKIYRRSK